MIARVVVPQPSANVTEVTILAWLHRQGSRVEEGQTLAEVSTEKANIEITSPASGILRRIVAAEKSIVPVGYVIALIGAVDDELPDVDTSNAELLAASSEFAARRGRRRGTDESKPRVRATPAARRLARELGVDLAALAAAIKVDRLTEEQIRQYAKRSDDGNA